MALLIREPRLWRGVGLAVFTQILFSGVFLVGWTWLALRLLAPASDVTAWRVAAYWAGAGLAVLVGVWVAAASGTLVGMLLNPLAYTRLAESVVGREGAFQPLSNWTQVWEGARAGIEFLVVNIFLLGLGFIPATAPFAAVAGFVFDAWFLGRTCLEYTQVLRGLRLGVRRQRARQYWGAAFGLGAWVVLWSAIPLVGSLLTAGAVAGAAELADAIEKEEKT